MAIDLRILCGTILGKGGGVIQAPSSPNGVGIFGTICGGAARLEKRWRQGWRKVGGKVGEKLEARLEKSWRQG